LSIHILFNHVILGNSVPGKLSSKVISSSKNMAAAKKNLGSFKKNFVQCYCEKNRGPQKRAPALTNYRTKTTIADGYGKYEKNKRADLPVCLKAGKGFVLIEAWPYP